MSPKENFKSKHFIHKTLCVGKLTLLLVYLDDMIVVRNDEIEKLTTQFGRKT